MNFDFIQILKYILEAKSEHSDRVPHSAASDLGLHCLPMSHKKDARLKWINSYVWGPAKNKVHFEFTYMYSFLT